MPPLIVTQETYDSRGTIQPTESEIFHTNALNKRMECLSRNAEKTSASESISNESQISTSILDQSRKFSLNHLLKNAVYPAEYSPNESIVDSDKTILNASYIVDHLRSFKQTNSNDTIESLPATNQSASNVQFDLDETIVDEELVLSLTQKFSNTTLMNETLDQEEHEVLDILEVLDEHDRDEQTHIDDDSVLAPLSQVREPAQKFEENNAMESFDAEDSDDDLLNEFSMSILDCAPNDLLTKIGYIISHLFLSFSCLLILFLKNLICAVGMNLKFHNWMAPVILRVKIRQKNLDPKAVYCDLHHEVIKSMRH